ncbi:TackOD1 domain-containing metal-binding protein [Crocinitomix algicola]|uniref:TackOD1 domain-containing metal-binding protein n=1 Tax=Crocinitomix algicola TaxID=1740263 RepID=UPI00082FA322|nr:hypothetical protein [Crocinitomix algicola]
MKRSTTNIGEIGTTIEVGDYNFLFIRNMSATAVEELQHHAAVVIEAVNQDYVRMVATSIRANPSPDIYLKPIFLLKKDASETPLIDVLADDSVKNLSELESLLPLVGRIASRSQELTFINSISFEAQLITKIISLLYVRELKVIEPVPYTYSNICYYYPLLSVNFDHVDEYMALEILNIGEEDGIFRSEFVDRVYLCSTCSSGHLSYREVCPKCSSSDTTPDDVIHHFPCGYVGPMKDFSNQIDDKLDCPKCNKRLRHIGVDYDKPSIIHECNNCNHSFQDFYVNAKCLSCGDDRSVETLKATDIRRYHLTKKGELSAVKGLITTTKDIDEVIGTIKFDTFKTMLKYEIERLKQTEGSSNICAIHITNSSHVYSRLGSELQRGLLKDLVTVIRGNIRTADVIAFQSSSTIVLSMSDLPAKIGKRILNAIPELLHDLIKTRFDDLDVHFECRLVQLDYTKSDEVHLQELLEGYF